MSFGTHFRRVTNNSLCIGARHVALRSCVERFCPLGFQATWELLERRFAIKLGQPNDPRALVAAAEFLADWRRVVLSHEHAEQQFRIAYKRLGLPVAKRDVNGTVKR
jgi:hypothetical protein